MDKRPILLIPSNPLRPRQPDEQFAPLRDVATTLDVELAVVDHNELDKGGAREVLKSSWSDNVIVYRGWMLRTEHYATFEGALTKINTALFTNADNYQRAHELPGWYDTFAELTPRSKWLHDASLGGLQQLVADFDGPIVIKDWVKSAKHAWHDACFVHDVSDSAALRGVCVSDSSPFETSNSSAASSSARSKISKAQKYGPGGSTASTSSQHHTPTRRPRPYRRSTSPRSIRQSNVSAVGS
jgi:hypothetical protein